MTPNNDVATRTYGCIAIITGTAVYEVTSAGQDRSVPLRFHGHLGEAGGRTPVRILAVHGHSAETVARGALTSSRGAGATGPPSGS
jgi:hypothetical protein